MTIWYIDLFLYDKFLYNYLLLMQYAPFLIKQLMDEKIISFNQRKQIHILLNHWSISPGKRRATLELLPTMTGTRADQCIQNIEHHIRQATTKKFRSLFYHPAIVHATRSKCIEYLKYGATVEAMEKCILLLTEGLTVGEKKRIEKNKKFNPQPDLFS